MIEPRTGLAPCLVQHVNNPAEPFNEFNAGLDHQEFLVADRKLSATANGRRTRRDRVRGLENVLSHFG